MLKMDNVVTIDRIPTMRTESRTRVISVTSGKGGVGKSNLVVNMAMAFRKAGHRVLVLDGDFGLSNIDILFNIPVNGNVEEVLREGKPIRDIICRGPLGIDLIPSSSGLMSASELDSQDRVRLIAAMEELDFEYDILLIDTGAGIHSDVLWLNSTANEIVVVTTPEPTAITDAYALIKVLHQKHRVKRVKLIVNQVRDAAEGLKVYNRISDVTDRFLNVGIDYLGHVPWDGCMTEAVRMREPLLASFPASQAAMQIGKVARGLVESSRKSEVTGAAQFFWQSLVGNV